VSKHLAIVLAAGKGTRMESDLPKVLVPVCGRPMIEYVLDALRAGGVDQIVVVIGYRGELVREQLSGQADVTFVEQTAQLGTGHAVMARRDSLKEHHGAVLVVTGDSPLTQSSSIKSLLDDFDRDRPACVVGTAHKDNPFGLGRIVRDDSGDFLGIVEEKDATVEQQKITEVNMSTYVFDCQKLLKALDQLTTNNAQAEYYITDCPGILKADGQQVRALDVLRPCEALSINNMAQLAEVEAEMRRLKIS
jgi:bifunctional UDP-N-acetylglucosamine pyrophosphorylase/glucosamine-1-phosphate N-acetyltransferase/UDP-N-acetylglucosamine pyrophosphorylase